MKKIKKLTALLLTLVMSLALAVPCFAAGPQEGTGDPLIAALQTAEDYHVEYIGGCRVTAGTISADLFNEVFPVSARSAGTYTRSGIVTPVQNAYVSYSYSSVYGYHCKIITENKEDPSSSTACLDAEYVGTVNGVPLTQRSRGIKPGGVGVPADVRVDQLRELPAGDIVGLAAGRVGVDDGRGGLRAVGVGICFASMPAANAPNRFIVKPLSQVGHLYCFKDTVMSLYAVPSS